MKINKLDIEFLKQTRNERILVIQLFISVLVKDKELRAEFIDKAFKMYALKTKKSGKR